MTGPVELDSTVWEAQMRLHSLIADLVEANADYTRLETDGVAIDDMGPAMSAGDAVAHGHEQIAAALRALAAADTALHAARSFTARLSNR